MRRFISFFTVVLMVLILSVGCSEKTPEVKNDAAQESNSAVNQTETKLDYPNRPITMIVPFSAGGSTDVGARILAAEAEKFLGQPIVIVNTPGAGGWLGWNDLLNAKKDGYTIAHFNDAAIFTGYLDPQQKRNNTLNDFAPIVCYVIDYNTISINPTETRFTNLEQLIEYAKLNEVTCTSTAPLSDEYQAMLKINDKLGTKFIPVHNKGASESLTAVMGGHVDVMFGNVGDTTVPVKNGQVKAIAVLSEERSEFLPDVPTFKEVTGEPIVCFSARGIGAAAGVDQQIMDILIDAFKLAAESETFKSKMAEQGLAIKNIVGDDYMKMMQQEEAELKEYASFFGWE
ncbi:MAG: tripartite tricarboxylate transporter substrate binding protein [Peptococcales bacterium]|jgi:tripartite-type tricarboxylate transporter receptor subunit TctC